MTRKCSCCDSDCGVVRYERPQALAGLLLCWPCAKTILLQLGITT